MRYQLTERALKELGKLFVRSLKDQLELKKYPYGFPKRGDGDKVASGKLLESIKYNIVIGTDGEPIIEFSYQDYLKYVNRGREAKGDDRPITAENGAVPIPALMEWIKIRGINAVNEQGIQIPPLSLAFAIRSSIWRHGIRKTNIFDESYDGLEYYFEDFPNNLPPDVVFSANELYTAIADDINNFLDNKINKEIFTEVKIK